MKRLIVLIVLAMTLGGCFPVFIVGAIVSAPWMSQTPNSSCYVLDKNHEQRRPCKPEETR